MNSSQHSLLCRYRYDPLDRLISHAQSTAAERNRFYCKSRLATEIQEAIGYSIVQHEDLLLAQQQRENDALDITLLATDLQRSVLHTLKKNAERHAIAFSPYGHRSGESGLTSLLGFNGERPDPVTGHYLLGNGYRAFNPVLMRFNSPDSLSPFGKGGLNAYAYCKGDPVNFADPTGNTLKSITNFFRSTHIGAKSTPSPKLKAALHTLVNRLDEEYDKLYATKEKWLISEQIDVMKKMQANSSKENQWLGPLIDRLESGKPEFASGYERRLHNTAFGSEPVDLPAGVAREQLFELEKKLHPYNFKYPDEITKGSEMRILESHIDVAHKRIRGIRSRVVE